MKMANKVKSFILKSCPLLMIYSLFARNLFKFDPWVLQKKRSDNVFPVFSRQGFRAYLCPFKVLKRKKSVVATPSEAFDEIS